MTEDGREYSFRIRTREGELIGVANARSLDLDQDFANSGSL